MSQGHDNSRPPGAPGSTPPGGREVRLAIELAPDVANGTYANLAMVNHNETEFILDFIFVQPQQPRAVVRSRVISSPKHTKRLMLALQDNLAKYERKYGEIDVSRPGPEEQLLQ
jgi:hypothetical protein